MAYWIDSNDNLWLFGGGGYDSGTTFKNSLNDLWKFDGTNWTWVTGSNTGDQPASYGTQNHPDPTNDPGARGSSAFWIDASNNLWLFGGDVNGAFYSDMWKFDGTNWTWVSGSSSPYQYGTYGTQGTSDPANIAGSRINPFSFLDKTGGLWLFGGWGYTSATAATYGELNDLWLYQP